MKLISKVKALFPIIFTVLVIVSTIICYSVIQQILVNNKTVLGIKTLKSLYEFENLEQFGDNVAIFQELVTPEVFARMTADNSDRILRIYLKFNGNASYVEVLEATDQFIIYSLVCNSIERDRLFYFAFKVRTGKVTEIKEAELFKFSTTQGWNYDPSLLPPLQEIPIGGE